MTLVKQFGKKLWVAVNLVLVFLAKDKSNKTNAKIRVYYGGAYKGDLGGPLVKVKRLSTYYPEHRFDFNLLYCLSNFPYLSGTSLEKIKRKGIPIILNQNGVYFSGWYGNGWQDKNKELIPAYQLSDYIFWQSEFCKESADKFLGKNNTLGEILFNAVDTTKFFPREKQSKKFTFLTTGVFIDSMLYRLVATVEAFYLFQKKHRDTSLTIAGYMSKKSQAQTNNLILARGLQNKIKVIGSYSQDSAPDIYASADAYIMLKYMGASPNVVIEAMASGLPVIYSGTGGVPELVGQEAGVGLFLKKSWESEPYAPEPHLISEAMKHVFANQKIFSINARSRAVEKFDLQKWLIRHREVFKKYVN
jgi:glycosyltransferase involved in cell wall biosynthesis